MAHDNHIEIGLIPGSNNAGFFSLYLVYINFWDMKKLAGRCSSLQIEKEINQFSSLLGDSVITFCNVPGTNANCQ